MSYVLMKGKERGDWWVTGSPHSSASLQADFCISRAPWRFLSSTSIHHAPHIIVSTQIQPCISARAGERRRGLHVSATGRKTDVSYAITRWKGEARMHGSHLFWLGEEKNTLGSLDRFPTCFPELSLFFLNIFFLCAANYSPANAGQ